ncbi:MAG TPA: LPS assembly protein LptD [bacterium]
MNKTKIIISIFLFSSIYIKTAYPRSIPELFPSIKIKADNLEYSPKDKILKARGNVKLSTADINIKASEVTYSANENEIEASGDILYQDRNIIVQAERARINTESKTGFIENGLITVMEYNIYVRGERIERISENILIFTNASYTTCGCNGNPIWSLKTKQLTMNLNKYANADNLFFNLKDVPVMYLPFAFFPVKTERETGFLTPHLTYLERDGTIITLPFYLVINRSSDITITPKYYSRRGVGSDIDFRYISSPLEKGEIVFSYLNEFLIENGKQRWALNLEHSSYTPLYAHKINVNMLSDREYFQDFAEVLQNQGLAYTESRLSLSRHSSTSFLSGEVDYYQNLLGTDGTITTYHRAPRIIYSIIPVKIPVIPGYFSINSELIHFVEETGGFQYFRSFRTKGITLEISPHIEFPFKIFRHAEVIPEATLNAKAIYIEGLEQKKALNTLFVPESKINILTDIERSYRVKASILTKLKHTIEPGIQVYYSGMGGEIHDIIQYQIPEKTVATFYLKNFLAGGFKKETSIVHREILQLLLYQNFFVKQDPLQNDVYIDPILSGDKTHSDNIYSEIKIKGTSWLYLNGHTSYNEKLRYFPFYNLNLTCKTPWQSTLSLDNKYTGIGIKTREILGSIDQKFKNINISISERYSSISERIEEGIYEMMYTSQCKCWNIRLTLIDRPGFREDRIKVVFSLIGLGMR